MEEYEIYSMIEYGFGDKPIGWKYCIHACNQHRRGFAVESYLVYKSKKLAIQAGHRFVTKLKAATYTTSPVFSV